MSKQELVRRIHELQSLGIRCIIADGKIWTKDQATGKFVEVK